MLNTNVDHSTIYEIQSIVFSHIKENQVKNANHHIIYQAIHNLPFLYSFEFAFFSVSIFFSNFSQQCLHFIASVCIFSAQNGHFFIFVCLYINNIYFIKI